LKRACGHEIGSQDHFGSLRRHYPHQVLRVPRKSRGSQPTAPLQETNYSRRLLGRKGIHSVTLWLRFSFFPGRWKISRQDAKAQRKGSGISNVRPEATAITEKPFDRAHDFDELSRVAKVSLEPLYFLRLHWLEILFFREDSRLVRRAALKHHSARHGLGSKTVEQELTEGNRGSPLSLLPPVL